ncbi:hypothetical protein EG833_04230, partial [archaeon]|nr:hypothetical protein [archaeon]
MNRNNAGGLIGLSHRSISWHAFMIFIPFIVLFWVVPFMNDLTIGNDYQMFSIGQQMELMFCLETGSFPLYIPGYSFGEPAINSTLGQLFHPLSHIASHMPGYWAGKALDWNTLLRLVSLALAQMALFHFLRRLKSGNLVSFLLSFITVYNLAMLALFRYGASLESWTGFIFLCSAIGIYYLSPSIIGGPLAIIASTYWLVCSGHPQFVYYGLLGAGFFTLVLPFFAETMLPGNAANLKGTGAFWLRTALFCCAGMALSSAYLVPYYYDFVRANARWAGSSYSWAADYPDTFTGTMNNLFQPLRTYVDGNFGGTTLFLAAALTPILIFFRVRLPLVIWAIWLFMLIVFLHM